LKVTFWQNSINYLREKNLNEKFIELLMMERKDEFCEFINKIGYIDSGIIDLALQSRLPVITQDKELAALLRKLKLEVFIPTDYLSAKFR
jgi:rRNA-processing protein FCF1